MEEYNPGWLLKRLNLLLEQYEKETMRFLDISPSQGLVLSYLISRGESTLCLTDLHEELGFSKATLSTILKKLKKSDYVTIRTGEEDDRKKFIRLTQRAYELEPKLRVLLKEKQACLCTGISEKQQEAIRESLQMMIANMICRKERNRSGQEDRNQYDKNIVEKCKAI